MADIDLKTETPDASLPADGFLFGADSQSAVSPSVYTTQSVATRLLGSTTLSGTTITANAPVLDLAQTWNNAAVTFTGMRFNVPTDSSAAGSLLMDLQVGGSSFGSIAKNGTLTAGRYGVAGFSGMRFDASTGVLSMSRSSDGNAVATWNINSNSFSAGTVSGTTVSVGGSSDIFLTRRGAANLRLGAADAAAPVAQTLSVQGRTGTDASAAAFPFTIQGAQGTGTGAGGSIVFQVAPAGSAGSTPNGFATALTIDSTRLATFATGASFPGGSTSTLPIQISASNYGFYRGVTQGGQAVITTCAGSDVFAVGQNSAIGVVSVGPYSWTSSIASAADLFLQRDAANTLALRNGTNAQTFNVYNTFTSFGSGTEIWERFRIFAQSGGSVIMGTQKGANGGTARGLEIQTDGTTRLSFSADNSLATFSSSNLVTGSQIRIGGESRITNSSNGVIKITDSSEGNFGRLQFGGTTSSFPALKRSSTVLQARLADDSDFAPLQGQLRTHNAYTAGAPTATGYLVLYDSNGTAYKVPAEAL